MEESLLSFSHDSTVYSINHLEYHSRTVKGDLHSQVVILCLHFESPNLHQVPVQPVVSEEELPLQLRLGTVVQQHQQAVFCALPLQPGGIYICPSGKQEL